MFFPYVTTSTLFLYVSIIYIRTYGLCFRTQIGRVPLVFGGRIWPHNKVKGQPWSTPEVEGLEGPQVWRSCLDAPWFIPTLIPTESTTRVFCPCPSRVPGQVPNNQKRRGDPRKLPFVTVGFFLLHQRCQKDRDGRWLLNTRTSRLASLEHVMCYGLKMFKDIFRLFQVVSDCNNTKFNNISYVSFIVESKYLSH